MHRKDARMRQKSYVKRGEKRQQEKNASKAMEIVCTDRESQYGAPEDNFAKIAGFLERLLGISRNNRRRTDDDGLA